MNYEIHITKTAEKDMVAAADYIEFNLHNPQAADRLLDEAEEKIINLSQFPQMFSLVDDPVLNSWGIRIVPVNNYLIFYTLSEPQKQVYIVRFLYEKRNWVHILKQGYSLE